MAKGNVSLNTIEEFLSHTRIALVGISREKMNIGADLFKELSRRGYEVSLVNPNVTEMLGKRCFARVQDLQPRPDVAVLLTSPAVTKKVVRDCAEAGIRRVWMYRGGGQGSVDEEAVQFCRKHGMQVVPGKCPFMFLTPAHGIHWVHQIIVKITGQYPKAA